MEKSMKHLNIRRLQFDRGPHSDITHVVYIDTSDIVQLFLSLEFNPIQIIKSIITDATVCPTYYSLVPLDDKFPCETFFIYCYNIEEIYLLIYMLFFEKIRNVYVRYFPRDINHLDDIYAIYNTFLYQETHTLTRLDTYRTDHDPRFRVFSMYINTKMTKFVKAYMSGLYRTLYGTSIGEIDDGFIENIICKIPKY